jgi:REP element-mobilizing transposase RayT
MFRKRLRLRDFDYGSNGAYFVTVCTDGRSALFAGDAGVLVEHELTALTVRFAGVTLDEYMVMPDHLHAIILILNGAVDLPHIMQAFKSLSMLRLRERGLRGRIWQRGYFDRVIRNDRELDALRNYIRTNPLAKQIVDRDGL